jgi:cytoskeletal protein CcmA (bactofilin family)
VELGGGFLLLLEECFLASSLFHLPHNSWAGRLFPIPQVVGSVEPLSVRRERTLTAWEEGWLTMATDPAQTSSSFISKGARLSGKVEFGEMATIEGEAEGEITGDEIEIAPSAVVMARITANRLKVGGQVDGEIVARDRIEVLPTARMRCTITTPTLVVTEGAQFDGDCRMPRGPTSSLQSESDEAKETGVSSFITPAQKAELHERGYSDDDIALMIPAVAHRILGLE